METKLDVREIRLQERHDRIFSTLAGLSKGDALLITNDHDPKPLYYQINAEQPDQFQWEYIEQGPEAWQVRITKS